VEVIEVDEAIGHRRDDDEVPAKSSSSELEVEEIDWPTLAVGALVEGSEDA